MRTEIWAHRGSSHVEPENTMAAFRRAVTDGADGIELDVQRTLDGELVVCHDEHLGRLAGIDRQLAELTLAELQELNIAAHAGKATHRIPTLREVLDLIHSCGLHLNIELKNSINLYPGMEDAVVALVSELGADEQVCYSSFNHLSMAKMAAAGHGPACGLLSADLLYEPAAYAVKTGAGALHPMLNSLQLPGYIAACHQAGLKVHVWTADEAVHIQACLLLQADALITNEPVLARELRAQFEADGGREARLAVTAAGLLRQED